MDPNENEFENAASFRPAPGDETAADRAASDLYQVEDITAELAAPDLAVHFITVAASNPADGYAQDAKIYEEFLRLTAARRAATHEAEILNSDMYAADQPAMEIAPDVAIEPAEYIELAGRSQSASQEDRRERRRALISAPVRVRSTNLTEGGAGEVTTTIDVSRAGIFFITDRDNYRKGAELAVAFPFSGIPGDVYSEQIGHVVRVVRFQDGRRGVAVSFGAPGEDVLVDSGGRAFQTLPRASRANGESLPDSSAAKTQITGPRILLVDADPALREGLSAYLEGQDYDVRAVSNVAEACLALEHSIPALLIGEIEGVGTPGFELCAYLKNDSRFQRVRIMLLTSEANPSDYSNAHALGATICMAKPFKLEKFGHMVRLLAPPANAANIPEPLPAHAPRKSNGSAAPKTQPAPAGSRREPKHASRAAAAASAAPGSARPAETGADPSAQRGLAAWRAFFKL